MLERNVIFDDVLNVLETGRAWRTVWDAEYNNRKDIWKGKDKDDFVLTLVVARDTVRKILYLVTVFYEGHEGGVNTLLFSV